MRQTPFPALLRNAHPWRVRFVLLAVSDLAGADDLFHRSDDELQRVLAMVVVLVLRLGWRAAWTLIYS
jgi:hypothetical protein